MRRIKSLVVSITILMLVLLAFGCSAEQSAPKEVQKPAEERKLEVDIPDNNSDTLTITVPTGAEEVRYVIVPKGEEGEETVKPTPEEIVESGISYIPGTEISRPVNEEGDGTDEEYIVIAVAVNKDGEIVGVVETTWKEPINPVIEDTELDRKNHKAELGETTEGAKTKYLLIEYVEGFSHDAPSAEEIWAKGKEYNGEEIDLEGSYYIYSVAKLGSRYSQVKCISHIMVEPKIPDNNSDTLVINVPEEEEGENIEVKYVIRKKGDPAPTTEEILNGTTYNPGEEITRPDDDEEYIVYVVTKTTTGDGEEEISGVVASDPWKPPVTPEDPEIKVTGSKVEVTGETGATEEIKVKYLILPYGNGTKPATPTADYIWSNGELYEGELVLNKSCHIFFVGKLGNKYSEITYKEFKWVEVTTPNNSNTTQVDIPEGTDVKVVFVEKGKETPSAEELWNQGTPYTGGSVTRPNDGKDYEMIVVTKDDENTPPSVAQTIEWKAPVAPSAPTISVNNSAHTFTIAARSDGATVRYYTVNYSRSNPSGSTLTASAVWNSGVNGSSGVYNKAVANSMHVYAVAKLGDMYSPVSRAVVQYKPTVTANYNVANRRISFTSDIAGVLWGSTTASTSGSYISFGATDSASNNMSMTVSTGVQYRYIKVVPRSDNYHESDPVAVDSGLYVGRRFTYANVTSGDGKTAADGKTYNLIIFSAPSSGKVLAVDETPLSAYIEWGGGNTLYQDLASMDGKSGLEITQYMLKFCNTSLKYICPQYNKYDSTTDNSRGSMWALLADRAGYKSNATGTEYTGKWFIPSYTELNTINTLLQGTNKNFNTLRSNVTSNQKNGSYTCWTCNLDTSQGTQGYYKSVALANVAQRAVAYAANFANNQYGALACLAF